MNTLHRNKQPGGRHTLSGLLVLLLAFVGIASSSCKEEEPEKYLPEKPVHATLHLDDAEYLKLQNIGEFLVVKERRGAFTYIGVGGLLVVCSLTPMDASTPYAAYDLACPYCYYRSSATPRPCVEGQPGGIYAVCRECGSKYDISSGFGGCVEGPGRQLQVYHTVYTQANRTLIIKN